MSAVSKDTSSTVSSASEFPFTILPMSFPMSSLRSLTSTSFFSSFTCIGIISSLFRTTSAIITPLRPTDLFAPSGLPTTDPPTDATRGLDMEPFFTVFLVLSFLLSLFVVVGSLRRSVSFVCIVCLYRLFVSISV